MATKVAYYTLTAAADPQTECTAWEAEADIASCEALGTVGEVSVAPIVAGEVLSQPNKVVFKVTTGTVASEVAADTALSNAATAVGGFEAAAGYTSVYTP
jgi:hypothetical protein